MSAVDAAKVLAGVGRSRVQSTADIKEHLNDIFEDHPDSQTNDSGEPVIPADALVDIFRSFLDGIKLMTTEEMDPLKIQLATNSGLEFTPQTFVTFIAEKTKHSPDGSPK